MNIIRGDITRTKVDAIVNAEKNMLFEGGGMNSTINKATDSEFLKECHKLNGCKTRRAKIT